MFREGRFYPGLVVRPSVANDVNLLVANIRYADDAENVAAGYSSRHAAWRSYRASITSMSAFVDGEMAAMWGMAGSPLGSVGRPWLMTTPVVERVKKSMVRVGAIEVGRMLEICPRLEGCVDATYLGACRLLEVWGFQLGEIELIGPMSRPFRRYTMTKEG